MKRFFLLLLLNAFSIALFARQANAELEKAIDDYIHGYESIGSYSGSILVVKNGKTLFSKGFGMADYDKSIPNSSNTKFYLGSNTKLFTAVSILILEERGLLKTEDFIQQYVRDFPSGDKITIHHLLTHTSGITYELPLFREETSNTGVWAVKRSLEEQIQLLKQVPIAAEPGSKVMYSNNNYRLLAYIIEKVSGKSYGSFLNDEIFKPCEMADSGNDATDLDVKDLAKGYFPDGPTSIKESFKMDWSNKMGQASVYSTTHDLYKFYRSIFETKLINQKSLTKICTPYAKSQVGTYGYGLFVFPDLHIYGFNGRSPGFSSELRYYDRSDKIFIAVLSNNYSAPVLRIMNKVASTFMGGEYKDIQIGKPVQLENSTLDSFTGTYTGGEDFVMPNAEMEVIHKDNFLTILWKIGGGRESILIPQSENSFLDKTFWSMLRFEKNAQGQIDKMIYTSFGKEYIAQRKL